MLLTTIGLAAVFAAYAVCAIWQRRRGRTWSHWSTAGFGAGLILIGLAVSPPLAHLSHHDFRAHMLQHLLIGMLAPLGLVLAAPLTLALRTLPARAGRRIIGLIRSRPLRLLSHPVTALTLNNGGMYLLYATPLYAATLQHPSLHHLMHVHFLAAGYLLTWVIVGRDSVAHRPSMRTRVIVLFISAALHAALGKLMYAYVWPSDAPHGAEQIRAAAKLMYYGGDLTELLLAIALFASWYSSHSRHRASIPEARAAAGSSAAG